MMNSLGNQSLESKVEPQRISSPKSPQLTILGIGEDGCCSLPSRAFNAAISADILVGHPRFLSFFYEFHGETIPMGEGYKSVSQVCDDIEQQVAKGLRVAVLCSGDPLFYGLGSLLVSRFEKIYKGDSEFIFEIIPHPSSMQMMFARLGIKWDDSAIWSYHDKRQVKEGKPLDLLLRLRQVRKVFILTSPEVTAASIAKIMESGQEIDWDCYVGENLGSVNEKITRYTVKELSDNEPMTSLHVLVLIRKDQNWRAPAVMGFFDEEMFAKRVPKIGLITKKEVRALSLAALGLRPGGILWDIGAGSGSIGIEALLMVPSLRVYSIESDEESVLMCRENAKNFGLDTEGAFQIIHGLAPDALEGLPNPDFVFIGGSKGKLSELIYQALFRMPVGGHLVVNAVTLDHVSHAYEVFRALGIVPNLMQVQISRGIPLAGKYLRYEGLNPVHIFSVEKKGDFLGFPTKNERQKEGVIIDSPLRAIDEAARTV